MRSKGLGKLCGFVLALMMLAQPILPTAKSVADIISAHSVEAATTISKPLDENVSSGGKNNSVSFTNKNGEIITQNSITLSDKERADDIIETLQETGIVDKNGKMVDLDVRENGKRTSLSTLANRISKGDATGDLTVNGKSASRSQVVQLESMRQQLETANLLKGDVEITDAHVKNLESLLNDLANDNIEYIEPQRNVQNSTETEQTGRASSQSQFPATKREEGALDVTGNTYKGNYINGANYETNHDFELNNIGNTDYYVDGRFGGYDVAKQLNCPTINVYTNGQLGWGKYVNVHLTLSRSLNTRSSVKYILSGALSDSGTIYWERGEDHTAFTIDMPTSVTLEDGAPIFLKLYEPDSAVFENGKTTYYETMKVNYGRSHAGPYDYDGNSWTETVYNANSTEKFSFGGNQYASMDYYSSALVVDWFPADGTAVEMTITHTYGRKEQNMFTGEFAIVSPDENIDFGNLSSNAFRYTYFRTNSPNFGTGTNGSMTFTNKFDSLALSHLVKDKKVKIAFHAEASYGGIDISEVKIKYVKYPKSVKIQSITVPELTYYSGETIPVSVIFDAPVRVDKNTKLIINGTDCFLQCENYIETNELTFPYVVKDIDTVSLNISQIIGVKDHYNNDMPITNENEIAKSFGPDDGVIIKSNIKKTALDFANAKFGIDDADVNQTATVILPINQGLDATWIANELVDIRENGASIPMTLPGFGDVEISYYLAGEYFSCDGGLTRYPAYVVTSGANETPVAIVARYCVPANPAPYIRKDCLRFYLDMDVVTEQTKCLPSWKNSLVDELGYHYFVCGTDTTGNGSEFTFTHDFNFEQLSALKDIGFEYFVKDALSIDDVKYITRTQSYEQVEDGYIKLENGNYVVLVDAEHPENQYDVEIVISEDLYNAIKRGYARADAVIDISYQLSSRIPYTYSDEKYFVWGSNASDKVVFYGLNNGSRISEIVFKDSSESDVTITLNILNGTNQNFRSYSLSIPGFKIASGLDPYLTVPTFSKKRVTLTNTSTDILFASNITARNASVGQESTTFTIKLYKLSSADEIVNESMTPVWTNAVESTTGNTLGYITVPAEQFAEVGYYAAVISASFVGGEQMIESAAVYCSDVAYITVKNAPAKVTLNKLESYSVLDNDIPTITYTVNPANAETQYTIQKSGENTSERFTASNGVISFAPTAPEGLKDKYIITVYSRSEELDPWSVDSMMVTVYNHNALDIIIKDVALGEIGGTTGGTGTVVDDTTVTMTSEQIVLHYLKENGYELSFSDFTEMRTDISLQKIVSVNYGSGVWGMLSDKMQWSTSDSDAVSINFEQGGTYSNINNYSYTSYLPTADMLIVGKTDAEGVTITATHAATGIKASFNVNVKTLKNKLFVFQFYPKVTTQVTYTNGNGEKRLLNTNERGELAVYEESGISSNVMALSQNNGEAYVGTIFKENIVTGEADVALMQLYPCNNVGLRSISNVTLTFIQPDGTAYNGEVTLRGGVYKNGVYCPDALIKTGKTSAEGKNGREDITLTVTNGKLNFWFDQTQFKHSASDSELDVGDTISYVFEYRIGNYQPGYKILNVAIDKHGMTKPDDSIISLKALRGSNKTPQIVSQTLQQYYGANHTPNGYTKVVTDYNENIGISKEFNMARLYTNAIILGENLTRDTKGYSTYFGSTVTFELHTVSGKKLAGQSENKSKADQIINLDDIETAELFVFPFSSFPVIHSTYLMTDETLSENNIIDYSKNTRIKAVFKRGNTTISQTTLPYGICNLSRMPDPKDEAEVIGEEINNEITDSIFFGDAFKSINVNEMLMMGFVFLGSMTGHSKYSPHLIIMPTENPETFKILAFVGYNKRGGDDEEGLSVNYDPNALADDADAFKDALKEMGKKKEEDKKDKKGLGGEGELEFNFYGTIALETRWDAKNNKWIIDFTGGSVGTNIEGTYKWENTLWCGLVPINVSLELGFHTDLEVAFGNKEEARAMLLDAAFGLSIEAFAGLGFDMSLVEFKLGVFGSINADFNFLYLTQGNRTGEYLNIAGEIGIKMKVKLLFIEYSETFCSTGFNWSKKWQDYDKIQQIWEDGNYAEMYGVTKNGRAYKMLAFADGTAMIAVDGGAQLESRDYLELTERVWEGGETKRNLLRKSSNQNTLTNIQTNAYPYSNPVFTEDGEMFLYISDNNNKDIVQSVVSYATKNGNGYIDMGKIDPQDRIMADTDVSVSGYGNNVFATFVRQMETPKLEKNTQIGNAALGMMLNATEIYTSRYNGTNWTTERLTENYNADMAPVVASSGDKAIVAWRSLNATSNATDLTTMFNVDNSIKYRIYNGSTWLDAQVAYNGASGTVNSLDAKMLSNGSALITYVVLTGSEMTSAETFYTIIGTNGNVLTTGRLTNDNFADLNAKVTAIDNNFIVAWYSEHDTGTRTKDGEIIVTHDIRLARISQNGSVDSTFIESIGGTDSSLITSDFKLSAPVNNSSLQNLSIVWSNKKDSADVEDAGKYQVNAVRFFETNGKIGVTAPLTVAETTKHFTVDNFDTYTDANGRIYAIILGSDYNEVENISLFDTIENVDMGGDVTDGGWTAVNDPDYRISFKQVTYDEWDDAHEYGTASYYNPIDILTAEPIAYIKLGSNQFAENSIEVTANADLYEVVPGLDIPVQFTVKNTGINIVRSVTISGEISKTFTGFEILPNEALTLVANYSVPETNIHDIEFVVTPDGGEGVTVALTLNVPDVGISNMKVLRESNSTRDIQVTLYNISNIPLVGSGKVVKIGFYKDNQYKNIIDDVITIDPSFYEDIDNDIFFVTKTVNARDLFTKTVYYGDNNEYSQEEIDYDIVSRIYARVWIEDVDELYPDNNTASIAIKSLSAKYGMAYTIDSEFVDNGDGTYTVNVFVQNNMLDRLALDRMVELYDINGKKVASKHFAEGMISLNDEEAKTYSVTFSAEEIGGKTPVSAEIAEITRVAIYSYNMPIAGWEDPENVYSQDNYWQPYYLLTDTNGKIAKFPTPIPKNEGDHFVGWYTYDDWSGYGEYVDENTVFTKNSRYNVIAPRFSNQTHEYTYEAQGTTINAICAKDDHDNSLPSSITLVAPTLKMEGAEGNENAIITGHIDGVENPEIVYKKGEEVLTQAPTTYGIYTASITLGGVTVSVEYEILKPYSKVETAPTPKTLFGNGSSQVLIDAGTATGGEMQYALGVNSRTAPTDGWSTALPTGTNSGIYYVWYKVIGDENHSDSVPSCIKVSIREKDDGTMRYVDYTYSDGNLISTRKEVPTGYTLLTSQIAFEQDSNLGCYIIPDGWYVVKDNVEISGNFLVMGTVNLVVFDGATLTISGALDVNTDATLNVYGQAISDGEINIKAQEGYAFSVLGICNIYGGTFNIVGGERWAIPEEEVEFYKENIDPNFENFKIPGVGTSLDSQNNSASELNFYNGYFKSTGIQASKNCEIKVYGGTIATHFNIQGENSKLEFYGGELEESNIIFEQSKNSVLLFDGCIINLDVIQIVQSENTRIDMKSGLITINRFIQFMDAEAQLNVYGGTLRILGNMYSSEEDDEQPYQRMPAAIDSEMNYRKFSLNMYGGLLEINTIASAICGKNGYSKINMYGGELRATGNVIIQGCAINIFGGKLALASTSSRITSSYSSVTLFGESKAYAGTSENPENYSSNLIEIDQSQQYQDLSYRYLTIIGKSEPIKYIEYVDVDGTKVATIKQLTGDFTYITSKNYSNYDSQWEDWESGIYVIAEDVTFTYRMTVQYDRDISIILCDGVTLTAPKGIFIAQGGILRIFAGTEGTGKFVATATGSDSAIGYNKNYAYGGSVYVHGGTIIASKGVSTYGIDATVIIMGKLDVYAGEEEHPEENTDNKLERGNLGYIRHGYMTIIPVLHEHNLTYELVGNTIVGTCSADDCLLENRKTILSVVADGGEYTGSEYVATPNRDWEGEKPTVTYYQTETEGVITGGTLLDSATIGVGYYYAKMTLGELSIYKAFTITPKTISITGANLTSRDYEQNNKNVAVESVTFDGANLALGTDYTATAEMLTDYAGNKTAVVTVTLTNSNYQLVLNTFENATVVINKIDYTGTTTASANLTALEGRAKVVTLPVLPDGASYGVITNNNTEYFTVGEINNGVVIVTSAKDFDEATESEARTFTISVTNATNFNDYTVTVTITPIFKPVQVIEANNVTGTYGDTSIDSIVANITTGDGNISYAISSGESVTVDENGNLAIVKAGKTVVAVIASETDVYAETIKYVEVTISPKTIQIEWSHLNDLVYNKTEQKPTAVATGLVGNDTVELVISGGQTNAGTYTATAGFATEQTNYVLPEIVTAEFSIAEKQITVTIDNKSSVYGESQVTLTATDNGIIDGDTGVYTLACDANETSNVGEYAITGTDTSDNYDITFVNGTYEVTKKTLTITNATLTNRDYEQNNLVVAVEFVTFDGVTLTIGTDYSASAEMLNDNAGNKSATVTVTMINGNYALSNNTFVGSVSINKVDYTGTKTTSAYLTAMEGRTTVVTLPELPDGASYGVITNNNTGFFTVGEIENSQVVVTSAKDFDEDTESNDLTFIVTVTGATNFNDYTVTVTITPSFKPVQVIEANNVTGTYGDTSIDSIVANITTGDGNISYAISSGESVTVDENGNLAIVKAGKTVVAVIASETEEYAETIKYVEVTISPKTIQIEWSHLNDFVYNKTEQKPTAVATGLVGNDTVELAISGGQTNAGTYTATASFASVQANYVLPEVVTAEFSIAEKQIIVTIDNKSSVYGESQVTLTATDNGIIDGDTGVYTLACIVNETTNVGEYAITGTDTSDNYEITFVNATYEVTARVVEIVWLHLNDLVYNGLAQKPTATAQNLVNGDAIELAISGEQINAGTGYNATAEFAVTQTNYVLPQVVTAEFEIKAKQIIVTIDNKSSVYGEAQVTLTATDNGIIAGDTNVYTLECVVTELSNVGYYNIVGTALDSNYEITFANETNSYEVTKKALTITANNKTITYGDDVSNAGVEYSGFVNNEIETHLNGELTFSYTYTQFGNVGTYSIIPSGYTSDNYQITFINGKLIVNPKAITVTIENKTSVYGETQVELTATDNGIVNNDTNVYTLECVVTELSNVGYYNIVGTDISENYDVTFENETNSYEVIKKALTITANNKTITYGNDVSNAGVEYSGFVNNETETHLNGELTYSYTYTQFGNVGTYAIIPSGYTSANYEITFINGTLTVIPKAITVTIENKSSVYGEAQVTLTATDNGIVNGDTGVYTLALDRTLKNVGFYNIIGTDTSENYDVTFANETNSYEVTKRPIVATANDVTIIINKSIPTLTFRTSEEIDADARIELDERIVISHNANKNVAGKYDITLSFKDNYTSQTVLDNYAVTLEGGNLYVLAQNLNSSGNDNQVEIMVEDENNAFPYGTSLEVRLVNTEEETSIVDYNAVSRKFVDRRREISKVYSIKLLAENGDEIQPAGNIIIKLEIPDYLAGRNFRILHIHSESDIEYVDNKNVEIKDGYVYITVDKLSEFAFVHLKANEEFDHLSFCLGWLLLIFNLLIIAYIIVSILLKKKKLPDIISVIISSVLLALGIISICLHICIVTVVALALTAIVFGVSLFIYFRNKKAKRLNVTRSQELAEKQTVSGEEVNEKDANNEDTKIMAKVEIKKPKKKKRKTKTQKKLKKKRNRRK